MKQTPEIRSSDSPQTADPSEPRPSRLANVGQFAGGLTIALIGFLLTSLLLPVVSVIADLSIDPSQTAQSVAIGTPQAVFGFSALVSFTIIGVLNAIRALANRPGTLWTNPFLTGLSTGFIIEAATLILGASCAFCKLT